MRAEYDINVRRLLDLQLQRFEIKGASTALHRHSHARTEMDGIELSADSVCHRRDHLDPGKNKARAIPTMGERREIDPVVATVFPVFLGDGLEAKAYTRCRRYP